MCFQNAMMEKPFVRQCHSKKGGIERGKYNTWQKIPRTCEINSAVPHVLCSPCWLGILLSGPNGGFKTFLEAIALFWDWGTSLDSEYWSGTRPKAKIKLETNLTLEKKKMDLFSHTCRLGHSGLFLPQIYPRAP